MKNLSFFSIVRFIMYLFLIVVTITVFYIFRPFNYVDNCSSYIDCPGKNVLYYLGPSFVYSFDNKLDEFNSKKAKKLCDYGIMWDYNDTYPTKDTINYQLNIINKQESSWPADIFISITVFIIGAIIIESLRQLTIKKRVNKTDCYFGTSFLKLFRYFIE